MKKYIKAKELLETKANKKEKKPIYATRKLSIGLVSCMLGLVMAAPVVQAEDLDINQVDSNASAIEDKASKEDIVSGDTSDKTEAIVNDVKKSDLTVDDEAKKPDPAVDEDSKKTNLDGLETKDADKLEIGPEIVLEPVQKSTIPTPTITKAFIGTNTISGGNVHRDRINKKTVRGTIHVSLKDSSGTEKANLSVTPKSGTTWTVNLPEGVTIAEGDVVTAYQEFNGSNSEEVTANAQPSKASSVTLTMPSGEIWIEQTSSNQVSDGEQAEAVQMLKDANTEIASDIKSVKFSIDGTDHAYYEVTYTDGSTSGKVEAPNLKINTVTETSAAPTIEKVQVTDGQIIVTFEKEVAAGTKFYFIKQFTDGEENSFCQNGKCRVDKSTEHEMSQAVSVDGKKVAFKINAADDLKLGRQFGIVVKEPHKFRSCTKSEPVVTSPAKVEVRDPKKLTEEEKKAIDEAIRDANTVDGVSKLPNGSGDWDGVPAVIQIDDSGNVKIFSGNDVAGDWDPNNDYKFVPEKNEDGSNKVKDGAEPKITIQGKDLLKNIKPKEPVIAVDTDTGKVTITPPAYKEPGDDTDLLSYTVTYKDESETDKTVTATRDLDTGKWSGPGVDENTGVITLSVEDIEVGGTVRATAKDNGGLEGDTNQLDSDEASKTLETATVSYDRNGGTGEMTGKTVNKGSKYKILENAFTAPENKKFDGWKVGNEEGVKKAGETITIKDNVVITANWIDGKVTKVTKEVIPAKTKYEADDTLEFEKQKVITTAVDGEKEITTVSQKGKDDVVTEKTTKEKVDGLVKVGNKKVEVKKDGDITITTTTTYEVNPNTGELINPKVVVKKSTKSKPADGDKTNPETPQPGEPDPSEPDPETPQPGKPDPEKPGKRGDNPEKPGDKNPNKPGYKPSENEKTPDKEKPTDPDKINPEKPGDKEPGKQNDNNEEGKKPGVEDRIKINYDPNGGHWSDKSTDILTYYYDRGNIIALINPPTREGYRFLYWKGSAYQPGDKYTVVGDHTFVAQWEKIGTKASRSNPKTGLESVAGVVCTLVASTGALYIGRKKED